MSSCSSVWTKTGCYTTFFSIILFNFQVIIFKGEIRNNTSRNICFLCFLERQDWKTQILFKTVKWKRGFSVLQFMFQSSFVTFQCGFLQDLHGVQLSSVQSSDLPHQKHLQASRSTVFIEFLTGSYTAKWTNKNSKKHVCWIVYFKFLCSFVC